MRKAMFVGAVVAVWFLPPNIKAQDPKSSDAAQSAYKILAQSDGEWDADVTMSMPGPDGKVTTSKSKGVETNRLLGGKWLISDFKGELFNAPFEGHGQNGYDAKKGKYITTWIDSVSPRMEIMEGTYDEKTKTLTLYSETEAPGSGKRMKLRMETQFKDDGTRTFAEYIQMEGENEYTKLMEVTYTRRKK